MHKGFLHRPQGVAWRKALFQIHLWAGVILGLYFLLISLSGSVLVFERELTNDAPDLRSASEDHQRNRVSYSQLAATGQTTLPDSTLQAIDMRSEDRRLVRMVFQKGTRQAVLYLDSASGRVVKQPTAADSQQWMDLLERLHNELLGGRSGAIANGIGGGLLALMCLTGIVLWWPGQRVWKRALTVNWRARWRRVNFDLHSAAGFWTLPVVFIWALSGVYFIFPDVIQKPFKLFQIPQTAKHSTWKPGGTLQPIDSYLDQAERLYPDNKLAYLYMDVFRPGGQVAVFLSKDPAKPLTLQEDIVRFDPGTAEVLYTESSAKWSLFEKILMSLYSIHFGDFGGTVSKVLWALLSLVLSLLTVTGYLMWWNRVLRKKWDALRRRSLAG